MSVKEPQACRVAEWLLIHVYQGAEAPNDFSTAIQIRWKLRFPLTSIQTTSSLQHSAHDTTTELSWHIAETSKWARWCLKSQASSLFSCWFRRRSKKTSKLRVTGLCVENSPVTGEFPAQRASNEEDVSIWWCHHDKQNFVVIGVIKAKLVFRRIWISMENLILKWAPVEKHQRSLNFENLYIWIKGTQFLMLGKIF